MARRRAAPTPAISPATHPGAIRRASELLRVVGEPNRLAIVLLLAGGEMHAGGICERLGRPQSFVGGHLPALRLLSVVVAERRGQRSVYTLTEGGRRLADAVGMLMGAGR